MGRAEADLDDSTILLRTLLDHIPFGIILLDAQGRMKLINQHAREQLFLDRVEDLAGDRLIERLKHLNPLDEELEGYLKQPEACKTFESVTYSDQMFDLFIKVVPGGFLVIIHDIKKAKTLESDSIQAIISGQENERRRLAREIHDGIGPLLSYVKLELDLFLEILREGDSKIPDDKLFSIRQTIDTISDDLRDLSHSLMPRLLVEFGLLSAFQNMVGRTKGSVRSKVDLYCNLDPEDRFNMDIELNLFRCGQELLNNALKHAEAKKIILQLIKHEDSIVLMVEDDGTGFSPEQARKNSDGIGLLNIETRVRALHGDFLIETEKERGTLVSIEIPL
jgi:signal transduction histidine kinase